MAETVYAGTGVGIAEIRGGKFARVLAPGYFAQTLLGSGRQIVDGTLDEGMFAVPLDAHPGGWRSSGGEVCPGLFDPQDSFASTASVYALAEDSLWRWRSKQ